MTDRLADSNPSSRRIASYRRSGVEMAGAFAFDVDGGLDIIPGLVAVPLVLLSFAGVVLPSKTRVCEERIVWFGHGLRLAATAASKPGPPRDFPPKCVFCGKKLWRRLGKRRAGFVCLRCP